MEMHERWFDDYTPGHVSETGTHLMTEEAILAFAGQFDPQPFHTDPVVAAESIYGGLIASGWHTGSVMMKLLAGTLGPASMGSPGGSELRWLAPVRPGDELRVRSTVLEVRASKSKPDRGFVTSLQEVLNQDDVVVMTFTPDLMLRRRSTEG